MLMKNSHFASSHYSFSSYQAQVKKEGIEFKWWRKIAIWQVTTIRFHFVMGNATPSTKKQVFSTNQDALTCLRHSWIPPHDYLILRVPMCADKLIHIFRPCKVANLNHKLYNLAPLNLSNHCEIFLKSPNNTWLPVSMQFKRLFVDVFQKRIHLSAVPPPEAKTPCWWGDHAIALTAAVCSLNLNKGCVPCWPHTNNCNE